MNLRSLKNRWQFRIKLHFGHMIYFLNKKKINLQKENIVIFHQGRCGSTYLEQILKKNKNINTFSEIYSKSFISMESNLDKMINYLSATSSQKYNFYEVKYGIENHLSYSFNNSLTNIIKNNEVKFVLLVRKNSLEQAKSNIYGHFLNKNFHFKKNDIQEKKDIVSIKSPFLLGGKFYNSVEKVSHEINEQTKLLIQFLKTHKAEYKIIYFEDLIEDTEKVLLKLFDYINLKNTKIKKEVKTIKTPIDYDKYLKIY